MSGNEPTCASVEALAHWPAIQKIRAIRMLVKRPMRQSRITWLAAYCATSVRLAKQQTRSVLEEAQKPTVRLFAFCCHVQSLRRLGVLQPRPSDQYGDTEKDGGIGKVEGRPMKIANIEVQKICDRTHPGAV